MNGTAWRPLLPAAAVIDGTTRPVAHGARSEPLWPAGVVGSVTHAVGVRAVVTAPAARVRAIGIDMEAAAPLPAAVWTQFLAPPELDALLRIPAPRRGLAALECWCLKEALFKALQGRVALSQIALREAAEGWQAARAEWAEQLVLRSAMSNRWVLAAAWWPA